MGTRAHAAIACWQISGHAKEYASVAVQALEADDTEDFDRIAIEWIANCLRDMGSDASEIVPRLLSLLKSSSNRRKRYAAIAIAGMGLERAVALPVLESIAYKASEADEASDFDTLREAAWRACCQYRSLAALGELVYQTFDPEYKPLE